MTQATNPSPPPAPPDDPLSHLHKMSRTAGLGSSDYVAVNGVAVAALLFGIGTALIVFDLIFLVIPGVALVLALIALRQVRRSAGTQTGAGLAWLAIALALGFTALLGSKEFGQKLSERRDKQAIEKLVIDFGKDMAARDYAAAYSKTSNLFQERITKQAFVEKFTDPQYATYFGTITAMKWNELVRFDIDNRTGMHIARSVALIDLKDSPTGDRFDMVFRKQGDQWFVDDIPVIFPPPPPKLVDVPGPKKGNSMSPPR